MLPIEFKITQTCGILAEQIGILLSDVLGKLTVPAFNYYPTGSIVTSGSTYSITFSVRDLDTDVVVDRVVSVVSTNTSVSDLLTAFKTEVDTNFRDELKCTLHVDTTAEKDMYMYITPSVGYSSVESAKVGMKSDPKRGYTESDHPACYLAMGKQPTSSFPRIVVTSGPQNTTSPSNAFRSGTVEEDGLYYPFTDKYVNYSVTLTCEAGSVEQVLESGYGAQEILQELVKRLGSKKNKDRVQAQINSTIKTSSNVLPIPSMGDTEYMDMATMTLRLDVIDRYIDRFNGEGSIDTVVLKGGTPTDEGIEYRMGEEDTVVRKYGDTLTITRPTS